MTPRARLLPPLARAADLARPATGRWNLALCGEEINAEWDALSPRTELFLPAVREICARHGLPAGAAARFPRGSTPVFQLGSDHALKLFCPYYATDFEAELASLQTTLGRLPVPTPAIVAHGRLEGWPYLIMTRLAGQPLAEVWADLGDRDRAALVEQLGVALAALHGLRSANERGALRVDWSGFLEGQMRALHDRQARRGLDESWLVQLEPFLSAHRALVEPPAALALLHTEPTDTALMAARVDGRWTLTGMLDFADAMLGAPEYDFAAVGIFVTRGDRSLFRRFLLAYGYPAHDLGRPLATRLMMLTLLHRYCHLPWFMSLNPPRLSGPTLQALAEFWFSCEQEPVATGLV